MKKIKNYLIFLILITICPQIVNAGTIRFNTPVKTSEDTYEFTLTVENIKLNSISGNINITNGTITNIIMSSSWINQTGTNGNFYFYRNGGQTGTYTVATIQVKMTGNSEYKIQNWDYFLNKCKKDAFNHYFGENGTLVSKEVYDKTCIISKDASLKSLVPSSGSLTPIFNPSLELYSLTVNNDINTISWKATPNNSKAKIISGSTCSLKVGLNLCKIIVKAEAGNEKTYTITVTRKNTNGGVASSDASIKNLQVHGGSLTKTFNSKTTEYNLKPDKNATQISFTFTMNSNDQNYTTKPCNITKDTKSCKLTVTAEDGVTKKSYLFNILQDNKDNSTTSSGNSTTTKTDKNISSSSSTKKDKNNTEIDIIETSPNLDQNIENNNEEQNNKPKENKDEVQKEETKEQNISKEKIKIPIVNKEMEKNTFFIIIAVFDLIIGIGIGILIAKHYKKKKHHNKK